MMIGKKVDLANFPKFLNFFPSEFGARWWKFIRDDGIIPYPFSMNILFMLYINFF